MTRPLVSFADAERAIVDHLDALMTETVGTFYPASSAEAPIVPFVQVGWDGTPTVAYPITQRASIRVTYWADDPTAAKAGCDRAAGLMATHPGDTAVWSVVPLTGPLPTRDPSTELYLVSATFRVSVRPTLVA